MENGNAWTGPLFIVGMPRSGTKLLRGLLNQHSRIRIPDIETDFLPFVVRWVRDHGPPASESEFAQLFEALKSATYFTLRRADTPFAWQAWRRQCLGRYDVADLFEGFVRYETGAARGSDCIWGDKSPAYIRHVALLLEQFPTARIVHIVRDVRDFCVSIRKTWNKDIRRAAFQWGRDAGNAHRLCMAHPERCIEIKYEELLNSPEEQMRRLSSFLGIEFTSAMTSLDRPVEARGDAAGATQIKQDNVRKFSDALNAREIRNVEALALDTMRVLGYQPVQARAQRRLSTFEERLLRVKDGWRLVTRAARRRGLAYALRFHVSHSRVSS